LPKRAPSRTDTPPPPPPRRRSEGSRIRPEPVGARRITLEFADVEQQVSAFVAPFLAWQFDVDTLPALDFGLALYGPAANGHRKFADQLRPVRATDARGEDATRFVAGARADTLVPNGMLVESELAQIFPTAAVAWRVRPDLSLGVSLQNSVVIARLVQGAGGAFPGQAELNVMDLFSPTAILGAQWRPFDALELGLAARPPVRVEAHGTAKLRRYADCQQPSESGCAGAHKAGVGMKSREPCTSAEPAAAHRSARANLGTAVARGRGAARRSMPTSAIRGPPPQSGSSDPPNASTWRPPRQQSRATSPRPSTQAE
jgi:hypothetical protein